VVLQNFCKGIGGNRRVTLVLEKERVKKNNMQIGQEPWLYAKQKSKISRPKRKVNSKAKEKKII
jgi:hypothetical protein